MNDFDYQGVPYFKVDHDCTYEQFLIAWIEFCIKNKYQNVKPKLGWLNEDFENFKITVVAIPQ